MFATCCQKGKIEQVKVSATKLGERKSKPAFILDYSASEGTLDRYILRLDAIASFRCEDFGGKNNWMRYFDGYHAVAILGNRIISWDIIGG